MTALKTVSLRLTRTKAELEEMGEETDGASVSVSEFRDQLLALTNQKVDILKPDGQAYKSTYQILKEMAAEWENMSQMNQQGALFALGGSNHANVIASLIKNFDDVEAALETSLNSFGSATAENEKYLESMEGKIAQFNSAMQSLSAHTFDSSFLKGFIDGGTQFVQVLDQIAQKGMMIPTVIGAISAALSGLMNWGMFQSNTWRDKNNPLALLAGDSSKIKKYNQSTWRNGWDLFGTKMSWNELFTIPKQYRQILGGQSFTFRAEDRAWVDTFNTSMEESKKAGLGVKESVGKAFDVCKEKGLQANDAVQTVAKSLNGLGQNAVPGSGNEHVILSQGALEQVSSNASVFSRIAGTVGKMALNAVSMFAITEGIQLAIQGIEYLANFDSHQIEEGLEVINKYRDAMQEFGTNTATLEGMRAQFEALSTGVDSMGRNISLSTDEYAEYQAIVQQIAALSPELVRGYDAEGNALLERNGLIDAAIEKQKEYRDAARDAVIEDAHEINEMYSARMREAEKSKNEAINDVLNQAGIFDWGNIKAEVGQLDNLSDAQEALLKYIDDAENAGQITAEQARAGREAISGLAGAWREASSAAAEMREYLSGYADDIISAQNLEFSAEQMNALQKAIFTDFWKEGSEGLGESERLKYFEKQIRGLVSGLNNMTPQLWKNIDNLTTGFQDGTIGAEELQNKIEEIVATVSTMTGMSPEAVKSAFGFDTMLDETERLLENLDEIKDKTLGILSRDTFSTLADARLGNSLYQSLENMYTKENKLVPIKLVQDISSAFKDGTPQAKGYVESIQKLQSLSADGNWGTSNFEKAASIFKDADLDQMDEYIQGLTECNRLISELGLTADQNQDDIDRLVNAFLDTDIGSRIASLNEMFDRGQIDSGLYDNVFKGILEDVEKLSGLDFGDIGDRLLKSLRPDEVSNALSSIGQSINDFFSADPSQRVFMTDKLQSDLETLSESMSRAMAAHDVQRYNDFQRLYEQYGRTVQIATDPVGRMADVIDRSNAAMQEQITTGRVSLETYKDLAAIGPEYANTMTVSSGAITLNVEALKQLEKQEKAARLAELDALQNGVVGEYQRKAEALQKLYDIQNRGEATREQLAQITSGEAELSQLSQLITMYEAEKAAINEVAGARAQLDTILSGGTASEDFMNSWGKLPELLKGYEDEGKWGAIRRALDTVFNDVPTDIPGLREMSHQIQGLGSDVEFFDFAWDKVKQAMNDGSFKGMSWVDDATGQFHIYESELEALSQATGLTMDFLKEAFNIAIDYDPEYKASLSGEDFLGDLRQKIPQAVRDIEGETQVAWDDLMSVFESGEWSNGAIADMVGKLMELGVQFVDAEGNAVNLSQKLGELGISMLQVNAAASQSRAYWQEMIQGCNEFNSAITTLADGTKQLDLNQFKTTAEQFGKSTTDMFGMLGEFDAQGFTFTIEGKTVGLDEARQQLGLTEMSYDEFKGAVSDPVVMDSPTMDTSTFIQSLSLSKEQLEEFKRMAHEAGDEEIELAIDAVLNAPSDAEVSDTLAGPILEATGKLAELQLKLQEILNLKVGEDAWGIPASADTAKQKVDELVDALKKITESDVVTSIKNLSDALGGLGSSDASTAASDLQTLAESVDKVAEATAKLQSADPTTTLGALQSFGSYGTMDTGSLTTMATGVDQVATSVRNLSIVDPAGVAGNLQSLSTSLTNAASGMQTFQSSFGGDLTTQLGTMSQNASSLAQMLEKIASGASKISSGNLSQLISDLEDAADAAGELSEALEGIKELDIEVNTDSVDDAIDSLEELQDAYDHLADSLSEIEATAPTMDISQLVDAVDTAIDKVEELRAYVENTGNAQLTATIDVMVNPPDISPVISAVETVNQALQTILDKLEEVSGYTISTEGWGIPLSAEEARQAVEDAATQIIQYLEDISNTKVTIDTSDAQSALSALAGTANVAKAAISALTAAIRTLNATPIKAKNASVSTGGHAKGIKNAPKTHMALVNDGAPVKGSSAELIIKGRSNEAYIANGGKLGMAWIEKGDTVLTAAETQKVFNGGSDLRYKRFGGGFKPGAIISSAGSSSSNKGSGSSGSSSNRGSSGSSSSSSSSSGKSTSQIKQEAAKEEKADTDARKEQWEKYYKEIKHLRAMDEIDDAEYRRRLLAGMAQYLAGCEELQDEYWSAQEEAYKLEQQIQDEAHDKAAKQLQRDRDLDLISTRDYYQKKLALDKQYYESNKLKAEEWKDAQVDYYKGMIEATKEELSDALDEIDFLEKTDQISERFALRQRQLILDAKLKDATEPELQKLYKQKYAENYQAEKQLRDKEINEQISQLRFEHDTLKIDDADFYKKLLAFGEQLYANNKENLDDLRSIQKERFEFERSKRQEAYETSMSRLQLRLDLGDGKAFGGIYTEMYDKIQQAAKDKLITPIEAQDRVNELWNSMHDTYMQTYDAAVDWVVSQLDKSIKDMENQLRDKLKPLEDQVEAWELEKDKLNHEKDVYNHNKDLDLRPIQDEVWDLQRREEDLTRQYRDLLKPYQDEQNAKLKQQAALQREQELAYRPIDRELNVLSRQSTHISKDYENRLKPLQEELKNLQRQNELEKEGIDLDKKRFELAKARTERVNLVYHAGKGFVYEADKDKIRDLQQQIDTDASEQRIKDLQRQIQDLQDEREKALEPIEERTYELNEMRLDLEEYFNNLLEPVADSLYDLGNLITEIEEERDKLNETITLRLETLQRMQDDIERAAELFIRDIDDQLWDLNEQIYEVNLQIDSLTKTYEDRLELIEKERDAWNDITNSVEETNMAMAAMKVLKLDNLDQVKEFGNNIHEALMKFAESGTKDGNFQMMMDGLHTWIARAQEFAEKGTVDYSQNVSQNMQKITGAIEGLFGTDFFTNQPKISQDIKDKVTALYEQLKAGTLTAEEFTKEILYYTTLTKTNTDEFIKEIFGTNATLVNLLAQVNQTGSSIATIGADLAKILEKVNKGESITQDDYRALVEAFHANLIESEVLYKAVPLLGQEVADDLKDLKLKVGTGQQLVLDDFKVFKEAMAKGEVSQEEFLKIINAFKEDFAKQGLIQIAHLSTLAEWAQKGFGNDELIAAWSAAMRAQGKEQQEQQAQQNAQNNQNQQTIIDNQVQGNQQQQQNGETSDKNQQTIIGNQNAAMDAAAEKAKLEAAYQQVVTNHQEQERMWLKAKEDLDAKYQAAVLEAEKVSQEFREKDSALTQKYQAAVLANQMTEAEYRQARDDLAKEYYPMLRKAQDQLNQVEQAKAAADAKYQEQILAYEKLKREYDEGVKSLWIEYSNMNNQHQMTQEEYAARREKLQTEYYKNVIAFQDTYESKFQDLIKTVNQLVTGQLAYTEALSKLNAILMETAGISNFNVPGYAAGRYTGPAELAITQEAGPEAIAAKSGGRFTFLSPGDKVFSTAQTEALWKLSNLNLQGIIPEFKVLIPKIETKESQNVNYTVSVGDVILNEVEDPEALSRAIINRLPNQMLQDLRSR